MIGMMIMSVTPRVTTDICGQDVPPRHTCGGLPKSPLSKIHLINSGFTTPSAEVTTMKTPTSVTLPRYGWKVPTTRLTVARSIGRLSTSCGVA